MRRIMLVGYKSSSTYYSPRRQRPFAEEVEKYIRECAYKNDKEFIMRSLDESTDEE